MGLLSRMGRGAGRFMDGASDAIEMRLDPRGGMSAPISSAVMGAGGGALTGAAMNPQDPGAGALMGAGIGGGLGAGQSLLKLGAAGLQGGMRAAGEAQRIVQRLKQINATRGGQAAAQAVEEIKLNDPGLYEEVLTLLSQ
jgi:hypothetical protein